MKLCVCGVYCNASADYNTITSGCEHNDFLSVCDSVVSESALTMSMDTAVQGSQRYPSAVGLQVWEEMERSSAQKVSQNPRNIS